MIFVIKFIFNFDVHRCDTKNMYHNNITLCIKKKNYFTNNNTQNKTKMYLKIIIIGRKRIQISKAPNIVLDLYICVLKINT